LKVISVVAGKGGVGKTTMSIATVKALGKKYKVGLLDADITGANTHKFLEIVENFDFKGGSKEMKITPSKAKLDGIDIEFMSIALLSETFVHWNPGEHGDFIKQIIEQTEWDVDYLIIDAPPGTHDELIESLNFSDVVILVTIPSELSHMDAKRTIELLAYMEKPIAGQIVNMSHSICPKCGEKIEIFKGNKGLDGIPVIEEVPIMDGVPELDIDKLEKHINKPITIKVDKKSLKMFFLKMVLKRLGK